MFNKRLICSIFCLTSIFSAFAKPVTGFTFSGLHKTKESYLLKVLDRFTGLEDDEQTLHDIQTTLQSEGLFEKIEINIEETSSDSETEALSGSTIHISVHEKITFIPLPFAACSNGEWMGGAVVINMNAFGTKTTIISGGFLSSDSQTGMILFSKPPANTKELGYSLYAGVTHSSSEYTDYVENPFTEFGKTGVNFSGSLSKKVTDFTTASAGLSFNWNKFSQSKDYPLDEKYSSSINASASISHGVTDWNGWFLSDKKLSIHYTNGLSLDEHEQSSKVSASITFQQQITERLRLCSQGSAVYGHNLNITEWSSGSGASVSILPSHFVSDELCGGNAGFELAIRKYKFGLLSIYGDYQICYVKNIDEEYKLCQGAGGGVRLYLSKIAFPAFAMGLCKNVTTGRFYYSGSIGISM